MQRDEESADRYIGCSSIILTGKTHHDCQTREDKPLSESVLDISVADAAIGKTERHFRENLFQIIRLGLHKMILTSAQLINNITMTMIDV